MIEIGIAEINKTPSMIDKLDEVTKIVNKKSKDVKGFFIPFAYKEYIDSAIEEIEYQRFLKRNKELCNNNELKYEETLLDGLDEKY